MTALLAADIASCPRCAGQLVVNQLGNVIARRQQSMTVTCAECQFPFVLQLTLLDVILKRGKPQ